MTRKLGALAALAAVLALTGCGVLPHNDPAKPDPAPAGYFRATHVTIDHRSIPCVTWKNGNAGGISCDWSAK